MHFDTISLRLAEPRRNWPVLIGGEFSLNSGWIGGRIKSVRAIGRQLAYPLRPKLRETGRSACLL